MQLCFIHEKQDDGKSLKVTQGVQHVLRTILECTAYRIFRWIVDLSYKWADFFRQIKAGAKIPGEWDV